MRLWPVAIIAGAGALLAALDAAPVRHAAVLGMGRCAVHQMVGLPTRVDVLALGSSRVRQGLSAQAIRDASGGAFQHNFNLGRSGLSPLRDYVMLRELIDRGVRPRAVVLELDIDALTARPTGKPIRLPDHVGVMRYRDAGLLPQALPALDASARARLTVLAVFEKVREGIGALMSGVPLQVALDKARPPSSDCHLPGGPEQLRLGRQQVQQRGQQAVAAPTPRLHLAEPSDPQRQQALYFVERVRALCRQHGIALVLLRPGAAYEPVWPDTALAQLRALAPEFVQPPADLVRGSWSDFDDPTHMGDRSRVDYSAWLAAEVAGKVRP